MTTTGSFKYGGPTTKWGRRGDLLGFNFKSVTEVCDAGPQIFIQHKLGRSIIVYQSSVGVHK